MYHSRGLLLPRSVFKGNIAIPPLWVIRTVATGADYTFALMLELEGTVRTTAFREAVGGGSR